MSELYPIAAKPGLYKGIPMKSLLEMKTAAALERIGLAVDVDHYESARFGDETGIYKPDFGPYEIGVRGMPKVEAAELYVETRPTMLEQAHQRRAIQQAGTLALSKPESLLIFVGLKEFPAALLGWCFGAKDDRVLAVIGMRRNGYNGYQEPCLFIDEFAQAWIDGLLTGTAS